MPGRRPRAIGGCGAARAGPAVVAAVLLLAFSPLYVIAGKPPPLTDAAAFTSYVTKHNVIGVTTKLADTLYVAAFIVFIAGLRQLIRHARPDGEMLPSLVFGAGLAAALVFPAGDVLADGAALDTNSKPDLVAIRALTEASLVAFGAIGFLTTALFLAAASRAILSSRVLSPWAGWTGWALALINLAAVPHLQGKRFPGNGDRRRGHRQRLLLLHQLHRRARLHRLAAGSRHRDTDRSPKSPRPGQAGLIPPPGRPLSGLAETYLICALDRKHSMRPPRSSQPHRRRDRAQISLIGTTRTSSPQTGTGAPMRRFPELACACAPVTVRDELSRGHWWWRATWQTPLAWP